MRWIFGLLLIVSGLSIGQTTAAVAQSDAPPPPKDRWHHVTAASPFYSDETKAVPVAAILQSDGLFARLVLGEGDLGAYVTVALPGAEPAPALISALVYGNGARVTRVVQSSALDTLAMPGAEMTVYSFAIAAEDIAAFRRASEWVLTPEGAEPVTITLDGSAAAIDAARATSSDKARVDTGTTSDSDARQVVLTALPAAAQ